MSQVSGQFQFLQRESKDDGFRVNEENRQVPLGLVTSPRPQRGYYQDSETKKWANAFSNVKAGLATIEAKKDESDYVDGKMRQMQGDTWDKLKEDGVSNATLRGFTDMKAATIATDFLQQKLNALKLGQDAEIDPDDYRRVLSDQFRETLTGNEYTDKVTTVLAADIFPKIASAQVEANATWRERQTFDSYRDYLTTASIAGNEDITDALNMNSPILSGLSYDRRRQAVAEAVVASYQNGATTLPNALGMHSGYYQRDTPNAGQAQPHSLSEGLTAKITSVAETVGVPADIFAKLVEVESNGDPSAVSSAGAQGLTQLMPITQKEMGVTDPMNADQSLSGGAKYLKKQLDAFDGNMVHALMAYNMGPGDTRKYLAGEKSLPEETRNYVQKILGVDVEGSSGGRVSSRDALLNLGFSHTQQSDMLAARDQYLSSKQQAWSADLQQRIDDTKLDFKSGNITYEQALERLWRIGAPDSMTKSGMGALYSIQAELAGDERDLKEQLSPEANLRVKQFVEDNKNSPDIMGVAAELRSSLTTLGVGAKAQDKAVEYLMKTYFGEWQKSKASEESIDTLLTTDQLNQKATIIGSITQDPMTLEVAREDLRSLLTDQSPVVLEKLLKEADSAYNDKAKKAVDEGTSSVSTLLPGGYADVLKLGLDMTDAAAVQGADFGKVIADTEAKLGVLAERNGWSPQQVGFARKLLERDTDSLHRMYRSALIKMGTDQAKAAADKARGITLFNEGRLHEGTKDERAAGYAYADSLLASKVMGDLERAGLPATPENYRDAFAREKGRQLAKNPNAIDVRARDSIRSLKYRPAENAKGEIDENYLNNMAVYKSLYDTDSVLAAKYADAETVALMERVMTIGSVEDNESNAIKQAFIQMNPTQRVPMAEINRRVSSVDFMDLVRDTVFKTIDDSQPGVWARAIGDVTQASGGTTSDMMKRAVEDPAFLARVSKMAGELALRSPQSSDDEIAKAAVLKAMGSHSYVAGNMLYGSTLSNGNIQDDMGIPESMQAPHVPNAAFHTVIDLLYPPSPKDYKLYGNSSDFYKSAYLSPEQARKGGELSSKVVSSRDIQYSVMYDPTSNSIMWTMVPKDLTGNTPIPPMRKINAETIGKMYVAVMKERQAARRTTVVRDILESIRKGPLSGAYHNPYLNE